MKQLNTARKLLAYLDEFSIPFSLNEEHAQVLLDYMEGSAYGLHVDEKRAALLGGFRGRTNRRNHHGRGYIPCL